MKRFLWLACALLAGCATSVQQAPVIDRAPVPAKKTAPRVQPPVSTSAPVGSEKDWRPDSYVVKKGDTLYSIGLEFGFDHKEIAQWNSIQPPYVIYIGQRLRLKDPRATAAATAAPPTADGEAVVMPLQIEAAPTGRPLDGSSPPPAPKPDEVPLLTEPKALKEPYSERALAAIEPAPPAGIKSPELPAEPAPADTTKPLPADKPSAAPSGEEEAVEWAWPANGKVLVGFSDGGSAKGMDIAGSQGQPVYAAAPGKVVYSGMGLRGYGKLIIIKHNKTYLSAYAHNSELLVKEGQAVAKGQKIAEMGNTDTDRVKLHFEIRKLGKPVDPAKYLPAAQ